MDVDLPYSIDPIADLDGHEERAWNIAWNPTRPILASCSADKNVRIYHYAPSSSTTKPTPAPTFRHVDTIETGHTKTVRTVAWSPSGETLATASFDSNIGIWQQEEAVEEEEDGGDGGGGAPARREWECVTLLEGHETECKCVAYSSTGTLLASCSRDKTVWVWEVQPDADFECLSVMMEHSQDVKCIAWHPTEEILASASYDDTINLYIDDPQDDWYKFATLKSHTSTVWTLAFSPSGNFLASGSDDRTVRVWERVGRGREERWVERAGWEAHARTVYSVSWGRGAGGEGAEGWIASTGGDGYVKIWEMSQTEDGALTNTLVASIGDAHGVSDVNCVAWCPRAGHETLLASAGDDGSVKVWNVRLLSEVSAAAS